MKTNRIPWPKDNEKLFITKGDSFEIAHYGGNNTDNLFWGYIEGYKNAADSLIDSAIINKDISFSNTVVFPIIFLYRQFIELSLKQIYIVFCKGERELKQKNINNKHDLLAIWDLIEADLYIDSDNEIIKIVKKYIVQYHNFDKKAEKFRYPIDKNFNKSIESEGKINLPNLKKRMQELKNFFYGNYDVLDELNNFEEDIYEPYI